MRHPAQAADPELVSLREQLAARDAQLASEAEQLAALDAQLTALQRQHTELGLEHQAAAYAARWLRVRVDKLEAQLEEAEGRQLVDDHTIIALDGELYAAEVTIEGQRMVLHGLQLVVQDELPESDPSPNPGSSADLALEPRHVPADDAPADAPTPDMADVHPNPDPAPAAEHAAADAEPADALENIAHDPIPDLAAVELAPEQAMPSDAMEAEAPVAAPAPVEEAPPAGLAHAARCGRLWGGLAVDALLVRGLVPGPAKAVRSLLPACLQTRRWSSPDPLWLFWHASACTLSCASTLHNLTAPGDIISPAACQCWILTWAASPRGQRLTAAVRARPPTPCTSGAQRRAWSARRARRRCVQPPACCSPAWAPERAAGRDHRRARCSSGG